jgi:hypothetical protein
MVIGPTQYIASRAASGCRPIHFRSPNNQTCGHVTGQDWVQPFVDEAIANVVTAPHAVQVTAAPKFYVPNCSAFDPKTTPHFTADGNTAMAQIIGSYYATDQ